MTQSVKLIIADDHPLIREGVKQILSIYSDLQIVGEASNGQEALDLLKKLPCDLLLLDINMPLLSGIEVLKIIKVNYPDLKILLLTVENDFHTLKEAIDLKVDGYILKDSAGTTLITAIRHILDGDKFIDQSLTKHVFHILQEPVYEPAQIDNPFENLSRREKEILFYLSKGFSNKEIASVLSLQEKTIRNYITNLFKKIDVQDRVQATIYALTHHLDQPF